MSATAIYEWLMGPAAAGSVVDDFDRHVLASILAISLGEAEQTGQSLAECVGLDVQALQEMASHVFPAAVAKLGEAAGTAKPTRCPDEECIFDLLWRFSTRRTVLESHLASMIARRTQRPNHLWQDLGLQDRSELSRLMGRHFKALVERNSRDMKWKKFLYRVLCRDEGMGFCAAPVCTECDDYETCFGEEMGDRLLPLNPTAMKEVAK